MTDFTPHPSASGASEANLVAPADQVSSDAIDDGAVAPATGDPQRHAAMVAAAQAIGTVQALDELTRSRLVRGALSALDSAQPTSDRPVTAQARRSPRWLVPAGSVAAAAALLVGVVSLAGNSNDPAVPAAESFDAQVAVSESDGPVELTDLGEVSDPARLRGLVTGDEIDGTGLSAEEFGSESGRAPSGGPSAAGAAPIPTDDCLRSIDSDLDLALLGRATYQSEAAVVATAATPTATVVYVIGANCTILSSLQVATGVDQP
jgi:hypothetical protein